MRKYYLENEIGERFSFLNIDDGIATADISGHGFSINSDYTKVGDMFVSNYREDEQGEMEFTVQFIGRHMLMRYTDFVNFLNTASELYLIYIPYDNAEYKRNVDVASVDAGSIDNGVYKAKLKLLCKSMFYSTEKSDFVVTANEAGMTFDFVWDTWFNDYSNIVCDISNDGHVESAFQIEFAGYVQNPKVQVFQNGKIIHELVFPITVMQGERMQYSTLDDDLYIEIIKKDGSTQNLISFLSMENENFFKLPKGKSEMLFACEGGSLDEVHVKLFKYYKAV